MDNKKRNIWMICAGVLVAGLLLYAVLPLPVGSAMWPNAFQKRSLLPDVRDAPSLNGVFAGQVDLDYAVPGAFNDPLPSPDPQDESLPELGSIDLGLILNQSDDLVSGFVDLDHTLVFTREHWIENIAFGPTVQGSFDGTKLDLESERVSLVSAGMTLERQFILSGTMVAENKLSGEYRETVWGYGPRPVTVVGAFSLQWAAPAVTDYVYLPLINN